MAVIELKSPIDANADIWAAFNQLQTYKNELSDLFICNEALVVSDGQNARIGSLTADEERFLPWKTVANENDKPQFDWQLKTVVQGFFNRELLLDYIRYFVLFENDGKRLIKKIAAYHQFHARESGGIIFTTVQKFAPLDGEQSHPALNQRSNIVVISDEAHRSQYGLSATLDRQTGVYKYGYAKHMRDALPNASFMGFTGYERQSDDCRHEPRDLRETVRCHRGDPPGMAQ